MLIGAWLMLTPVVAAFRIDAFDESPEATITLIPVEALLVG